jgi:hypothetical protein
VNYLLFFLASTSVEVIIVLKLQSELKDKQKKIEKMKAGHAHTVTAESSFRKKRKQQIDDRS